MMGKTRWLAAVMAAGAFCATSFAQTDTGMEDFESAPLGTWTNASVFGGGPDGAMVVNSGTARGQELEVDINMDGSWNSGFNFTMPMSGNFSRSMTDYELELYFHVDPSTHSSLSVAGSNGNTPLFTLNLYNPDVPNQGTEFSLQEVTNYTDAVTNGAVLLCEFTPESVYTKWDKQFHVAANIPAWTLEFSYGFGGGNGNTGNQPILMALDDIVVRYIEPPMVNPEGSPAAGFFTDDVKEVFTNNVDIVGTVYDGTSEVETLELLLDGVIVNATSNHLGGSTTNMISYTAMDIAPGVHTAEVKGYDSVTNVVSYSWDFDVVSMIVPEGAGTPEGLITTNDVVLTGTIVDGAYEVDTLELYLDGGLVKTTTNHVGGSITNVITYNAMGLSDGSHSMSVIGYDTTGTNVVHNWLLFVTAPPAPPATELVGLYNINIQGTSDAAVGYKSFPVWDGTVAAAPSVGDNNWNNVNWDNNWWWGWLPINNLSEASGNPGFPDLSVTIPDPVNQSFYCIWNWEDPLNAGTKSAFYAEALAISSNTMWASAYGGNNVNSEIQVTGLDSSLNYDLYLYFIAPDNFGVLSNNYTLTTGYSAVTSVGLNSSQGSVWVGGTISNNFVEGENYVTITDITPVNGEISFRLGAGPTGGGLSAFQLGARQPVATVIPDIQTIDPETGMVELTWDSQKFISYSVLSKADLNDPTWVAVTNGIPGSTNATTTATVPMGVGNEFYIIQSE